MAALLLACTGGGWAQDCLEHLGQSAHGWSEDVAVSGEIAALGNGRAMQLIDLADPANPAVIGETVLPLRVEAVEIDGNRAYVATRRELIVVDISDPADPMQLGTLEVVLVNKIVVEGDLLFILTYHDLSVVDVSEPASPAVIGFLSWGNETTQDLAVQGTTGLVIVDGELQVVDLSDPTVPTVLTTLAFGGERQASAMAAAGDVAFVYIPAGAVPPWTSFVVVVDVSDPAQPVIIAEAPGSVGFYDGVVHGDLLLVSSGAGLEIFDVSDPTVPQWRGSAPLNCYQLPGGVAAAGSFALTTCETSGLSVFDISNPAAPSRVAVVAAAGSMEDAAIEDGTLFIAAEEHGLRIVDVADPTQPVEIGEATQFGYPHGVAVDGATAYVAAHPFFSVDISDPTAPVILDSIPEAWGGWITMAGDRAFVVGGAGETLWVIDLSSPSALVLLASVHLGPASFPGWQWPVVIGDSLIVRNNTWPGSIVVFDVSDPTVTTQVATIDLSQNVGGLAAVGKWLLVPDGGSVFTYMLRVFDMGDPAGPVEVAPYIPVGGVAGAVGVAGSVAHLAVLDLPPYQNGAIEVVNFSRPSNPVFMDLIERPGRDQRFAFGPDELYVYDRDSGFDIYALCHDPLFADGFESGDTSAWSSAVP